jgi:hypothetical protein
MTSCSKSARNSCSAAPPVSSQIGSIVLDKLRQGNGKVYLSNMLTVSWMRSKSKDTDSLNSETLGVEKNGMADGVMDLKSGRPNGCNS